MVRSVNDCTPFEAAHGAYASYGGQLDAKPPEYVFMAGYIACAHQTVLDINAIVMANGLDVFRPNSPEAQYMQHFKQSLLDCAKRIATAAEKIQPQPKETEP